ncbi:MAG: Bax inhibitor-1/YccA family protein, partial [Isosphaeraceae bacterium]
MSSIPTKTGNPAFSGTIFDDWAQAEQRSQAMTVQGTALKALVLLAILTATASVSWTQAGRGDLNWMLVMGSGIAGFVLALATIMRQTWAPYTAPFYAACQGVFLGAIS